MKQKEYKVLGHKVAYSVPESSAEFNALDPKRADAACDEAVSNIIYRSLNPDTRYWFLHGRSEEETKKLVEAGKLPATATAIIGVEEETGIDRKVEELKDKEGKARVKNGEPVTKFIEAEEVFYNRVLATLVADKKYASEDLARAHFQDLIASVAAEVPFDVASAEKTERGPKKLAIKYKNTAAKVLTLGNLDKVNANQLTKIGKSFEVSGDNTKLFAGSFEDSTGKEVQFSVSDKDAEALGWLIKEYFDWKASQEMLSL